MKNKKGFTLIELVVSMSISILVMISFSVTFAGIMKNYRNAKKINTDMVNAQHALSLMGKTIRTSTLKYPTGTTSPPNKRIVVYDYSQGGAGLCTQYSFNGGMLRRATSGDDESSCGAGSFAGPGAGSPMTSGVVDGDFYTIDSDGDEATGESFNVGRVTVMANIETNGVTKSTDIQTSVSLRDYSVSNVGIDVD